MAYINQETKKNIMNALKLDFPEYKFGARIPHHSFLDITVKSGPGFGALNSKTAYGMKIRNGGFETSEDQNIIFEKMEKTIKEAGNYFDKSDAQVDYFHTAFYYEISASKL